MRLRLERPKCVGHAQCYAVAPDLFPIDDEGYCVVEDRTINPADEALARAGVAACPEGALVIDETTDD